MKKLIALALVAVLTLGAFASPVRAAESRFGPAGVTENYRHHDNRRPGPPVNNHRPQPGRPNHHPQHNRPGYGRPHHNRDSAAKWVGLGIGALAVIGAIAASR